MKDNDVKYCDEQIAKMQEHLGELNAELAELMKQSDDYAGLEKYYKEERKELIPKIQWVRNKIHSTQCELGKMKHHRSELKKMKKFMEYQHRIVDNSRKKKC